VTGVKDSAAARERRRGAFKAILRIKPFSMT
jgi:hypothetical protein